MKNNVIRVTVYDSEEWETMKSLSTNTIKEMNIALAAKAKTKAETTKAKKSRTLRSRCIKSRELVESNSDSDDKSAKMVKPNVKETKTIPKDPSLLLPELVKSGHAEFDARHRAKLGVVTDIQQSLVTSSPKTITTFGQIKVQTQLSANLEKVKTIVAAASKTSVLLNYTIPKKDSASKVQSTSKD